ncbi:nucleoside deaminase [Dictyobacter formicarum]|uniref:tRNA-specific adenosine deaminase n=1 Tax=Dictyobacter formicarum TaxID=2778368 RepID=A0ABQ3VIJ9_9CHLR|nr:nucleoside deaminase [Dictyobacter formicarum]GHO85519.1 tRNA-specific adenosine deaminase [Dictyobacter formicarum]
MKIDRFYLEIALEEAEQAAREGTYPIGALIVGPDGTILSRGHNRVYSAGDYTAHAEVDALRHAGGTLMGPSFRGQCTLYTTLEPCLMCTGALLLANIARVVWAANDPDYGALHTLYHGGVYPALLAPLQMTATPEPDIANRVDELMQQWIVDPKLQKARWTKVSA